MQLAAPRRHAKEIQPHRRMRIGEHAGNPRVRGLDLDPQFLAQLAHQRMVRCLARLDLAAGEFPIAGPDFIGRALGEEEGAVGALQDGGGNFDDFCVFGLRVQCGLSNKAVHPEISKGALAA